MRLFGTAVVALATAAAAVSAAAVDPSEIPSCAIPCMLKTLTVVNCTVVDSSCICRNAAAITADMMPCLLRNCTMEIALKMARVQAKMCDQPAESRQRQLMAATVVCFTLQAFFIALKFYTRKVIQGRLMMDDWILVAAVVSPLIGSAVLFWSIDLGLGTHMFQIESAETVKKILISFILSAASYPWTLGLVRISLLVFLLQTFPDRRFQLMVKFLIVYTALHTVAFFFAVIFQCTPVPFAWDKEVHGKCLNLTSLTYAAAVLSGLLDLVTLLLPINELRKLQMSFDKKLGVILIFIIGSCGSIAGFVRIKEIRTFSNDLSQDPDITWNYVNITLWTEIEITGMILCTCIPSLRPLIIRCVPASAWSLASRVTSLLSTAGRGGRSSRSGASAKLSSSGKAKSTAPIKDSKGSGSTATIASSHSMAASTRATAADDDSHRLPLADMSPRPSSVRSSLPPDPPPKEYDNEWPASSPGGLQASSWLAYTPRPNSERSSLPPDPPPKDN